MVPYSAMLDVPRHAVEFLARHLAAHRRMLAGPKGSRALTPFHQALFALRWFREAGPVQSLARDAGISQDTGYRYLYEALDVLADQAPDLHRVLRQCRQQGMGHVVLDGTLIACDRVAGTNEAGNDAWYSGKATHFAGNVQFLAAPDCTPLWVFDVEPGSHHDLTCARIHAFPALYPAAVQGLPTLADAGYLGAGSGIPSSRISPRASRVSGARQESSSLVQKPRLRSRITIRVTRSRTGSGSAGAPSSRTQAAAASSDHLCHFRLIRSVTALAPRLSRSSSAVSSRVSSSVSRTPARLHRSSDSAGPLLTMARVWRPNMLTVSGTPIVFSQSSRYSAHRSPVGAKTQCRLA